MTFEYKVEQASFNSNGTDIVGRLLLPERQGRSPAVTILGPVGFVKEQAPIQYATRLAKQGFAVLLFDPRFHGESGGEPRRFESGEAKTQDVIAAIDYLCTREQIDHDRIGALGICQGVNWTVRAANIDTRIRTVGLVAGHYLLPDVAINYLGSAENLANRLRKAKKARLTFESTGKVDYIHIVSPSLDIPDPEALLSFPAIQKFYIRWQDREQGLEHRGLWENRITTMSESLIWEYDVRPSLVQLATPLMMIHADRAATGPKIPRQLFETINSSSKELVWLENAGQIQFYEDPIVIDSAISHLSRFFDAN